MKKVILISAIITLLALPSVSLAQEQEISGAAAEAAEAMRLALSQPPGAEELSYDWTGNGIIDQADVKALLMAATDRLSDKEALQSALENSLIGEQHLELFSYKEPTFGDFGSYRSDRISVTVEKVQTQIEDNPVTYFVADIYIRDLNCLRTGLSDGYDQYVTEMAADNNAILAISGDYYRGMKKGLVIRNGELIRKSLNDKRDICVLYADGVMETYLAKHKDVSSIMERGPWQSWCFGPALLDDEGQPKTKFNTTVSGANPRAAIGYYEPGHYCFVLVDGRDPEYSFGLTMKQLSQLFYDLGCKAAFNLDGGQTAVLATQHEEINQRVKKNRGCSDMIYLSDDSERWSVDVKDFYVAPTAVEIPADAEATPAIETENSAAETLSPSPQPKQP